MVFELELQLKAVNRAKNLDESNKRQAEKDIQDLFKRGSDEVLVRDKAKTIVRLTHQITHNTKIIDFISLVINKINTVLKFKIPAKVVKDLTLNVGKTPTEWKSNLQSLVTTGSDMGVSESEVNAYIAELREKGIAKLNASFPPVPTGSPVVIGGRLKSRRRK
jgi:hypothetical protein